MTRSSTTAQIDAPLVLTPGEPGGIGPEIILKSWRAAQQGELPVFCALGPLELYQRTAEALNLPILIRTIDTTDKAATNFSEALPVLPCGSYTALQFGQPDSAAAKMVITALDKAIELCVNGQASGLVTAPIHKGNLRSAGFTATGHTDYLGTKIAQLTGTEQPDPVMMLTIPEGLRVVPATVHMALSDVPDALSIEKLIHVIRITDKALRHFFGIRRPDIAVTGLNPHAGEQGHFGDEEERIISPAIMAMRQAGLAVQGPFSADSLFHAEVRTQYDAAIAMYHDQALIPLKTINFAEGVNITLGLPIIRTSPDHGTAFDIAGKGKADSRSMIAAIAEAGRMAAQRAKA